MSSIPSSPVPATAIGLFALVSTILILPLIFKKIEKNLKPFFREKARCSKTNLTFVVVPKPETGLKRPPFSDRGRVH